MPVVTNWRYVTLAISCLVYQQAAERIGGAQGKYKKWGPIKWTCKGGLGARPQEILRFYMLCSVFWGLQRLFFVHAHSSCRLRLAVLDRKCDERGPS